MLCAVLKVCSWDCFTRSKTKSDTHEVLSVTRRVPSRMPRQGRMACFFSGKSKRKGSSPILRTALAQPPPPHQPPWICVKNLSLTTQHQKDGVGPILFALFQFKIVGLGPPPFSPFPAYKKRRLAVPAAVVRCLTCCVVPVRLVAHRT